MGSWNETCDITHLPIEEGSEIVFIPLYKRQLTLDRGVYVDDLYVPITTPIYGKYDDYGSLEDCSMSKKANDFLLSLKYSVDGNPTTFNSVNDLLDVLNRDVEIIGDSIETYTRPYKFECFICYKEIFDIIVNDVKSRTNYKNLIYSDVLENLYNKVFKEKYDEYSELKGDTKKILRFEISFRILEELSFFPSNFNHMILTRFMESVFYSKATDEDIAEILTLKFFSDGLDLARMGYLTSSGKGSQSSERYMQKLIAKFVLNKCTESHKTYCEECGDDYDESKENKFLKRDELYWPT